jgi:phage-related protein
MENRKYFLTISVISAFCMLLFIILAPLSVRAAEPAPDTLEEAQSYGKSLLLRFPDSLKGIWSSALNVWNDVYSGVRNFISPYYYKIKGFFINEAEKIKPGIKEELEKEKEELKVEVPKATKSIWQRFKDLISWWKD